MAPLLSSTEPLMVAVTDWPRTGEVRPTASNIASGPACNQLRRLLFITLFLPSLGWGPLAPVKARSGEHVLMDRNRNRPILRCALAHLRRRNGETRRTTTFRAR